MKKLILTLAVLLAVGQTYAQDRQVRKARSLMEDVQNLMANKQRKEKETIEMQEKLQQCKEMIAPTLSSPETKKELANAWDIQSKLYKFTFSPLLDQVIAKQPTDTLALYQNVLGSLDAMEECFKVENASQKEHVYSKLNELDVERFRPYLAFCGQMFFTNKQYTKAVEAFSVWMDYCQRYTILAENAANLIADPQTPQIAYYTCLCAYFAKDFNTLNKYISQAKQYEDEIDNVNQLYASALIEQGDTAAWATELRQQAIEHPNNEASIQNLLAYYFQKNQQAEAGKFAKELIEADPNNKLANYAMGVVNMNSNKYKEAIPYFDKAIEVDPEYTDAYYNAGVCYSNYGYSINEKLDGKKMTQAQYNAAVAPVKEQYRLAEPYFLKVKEMMPDKPDMWASRLSTIYYILGNKAKQAEMDKLLKY
ncbi:MAG: tetratricopeptide repeat protein [Bacteroidaceae bacterium]|nr:tetratricopeptide repeat protein [Bacteroidaceae bacterium]